MRLMAAAAALFLSSAPLGAQVEIRSLTGIIEGHEVGGVTIDMIGTSTSPISATSCGR
jgi:hypothetical protein